MIAFLTRYSKLNTQHHRKHILHHFSVVAYLLKVEGIVILYKPIFHKRYVDDKINRRKKHEEDILLKKLNSYHPKFNLAIEINPPKFLDTEIIILKNEFLTSAHRKESKLPVPW